jgi:ABC-type polysaccharide/polyol phosphate export permease
VTTFGQSLHIQGRVINALLMREVITRFGRENLGVLWLVAEPMVFTLGVTAFWYAAKLNHGSAIPIVAFAITGYSSVLLWRNTVNRANGGIHANLGLLYHRNVRVIDVFISRIIVEMAGATGSFLVLGAFFTLIEQIAMPVDPLMVLAGWGMLAWFGAALSIVVGAATAYSEIVERVWGPVSYLIFPLSGAAFMVDWVPPAMREVVLYMPMVHGVEMVRDGYFGDIVRTHYDIGYVALVNLVLTLLGLLLLRDAAKRTEMK